MGNYFNPKNGRFTKDRNYEIYVDKTGLLNYLNECIYSPQNCISVSHARRFGKSHAAGMIDAYYSLGSDSSDLFADTEIAKSPNYKTYLNKYNVIHIDVSSIWDFHKDDLLEFIHKLVTEDLKHEFKDNLDYNKDLYLLFSDIYNKSNIPFVIIIDEWDCVIRNSGDEELVHKYLQFLHSIFKSEESKSFLALAYITGILPIKKIRDESALNNFDEFTMLKSKPITKYYGFTEEEVKGLCAQYGIDFESTKAWYDGYLIDGIHMYNPNSILECINKHQFASYLKPISSLESIKEYITINYDGVGDDIRKMLSGGKVHVNCDTFLDDFAVIANKNDVLTALIHLGYLAYDEESGRAYIPNYEVKLLIEGLV